MAGHLPALARPELEAAVRLDVSVLLPADGSGLGGKEDGRALRIVLDTLLLGGGWVDGEVGLRRSDACDGGVNTGLSREEEEAARGDAQEELSFSLPRLLDACAPPEARPLPPPPISSDFPVLARACLCCMGDPNWVLTSLRA